MPSTHSQTFNRQENSVTSLNRVIELEFLVGHFW